MSGTVTLILPCMPEMLQGKGAGEAVGGAVLHPTTGPHNVHHARMQNYPAHPRSLQWLLLEHAALVKHAQQAE
jgi:hypothetical protein